MSVKCQKPRSSSDMRSDSTSDGERGAYCVDRETVRLPSLWPGMKAHANMPRVTIARDLGPRVPAPHGVSHSA
jgi:hypothetical protein